MANLKDIAQKLGVSVSTVSRGLNGGKEISRVTVFKQAMNRNRKSPRPAALFVHCAANTPRVLLPAMIPITTANENMEEVSHG